MSDAGAHAPKMIVPQQYYSLDDYPFHLPCLLPTTPPLLDFLDRDACTLGLKEIHAERKPMQRGFEGGAAAG